MPSIYSSVCNFFKKFCFFGLEIEIIWQRKWEKSIKKHKHAILLMYLGGRTGKMHMGMPAVLHSNSSSWAPGVGRGFYGEHLLFTARRFVPYILLPVHGYAWIDGARMAFGGRESPPRTMSSDMRWYLLRLSAGTGTWITRLILTNCIFLALFLTKPCKIKWKNWSRMN